MGSDQAANKKRYCTPCIRPVRKEYSAPELNIRCIPLLYYAVQHYPLMNKEETQKVVKRLIELRRKVSGNGNGNGDGNRGHDLEKRMKGYLDTLVKSNMRLVAFYAAKLRSDWHDLTFFDLVQEGSVGLMLAVNDYDPGRGAAFATYAVTRIRRQMFRALEKTGNKIKLPPYVREDNRKIDKFLKSNPEAMDMGYDEMIEFIAESTGMSRKRARNARKHQMMLYVDSLDRKIFHGEGRIELKDLIADSNSEDPEFEAGRMMVAEHVNDAINNALSEDERFIVLHRDIEEQTFQKIGETLNSSRQNVEQRRKVALGKLRAYLNRKFFIKTSMPQDSLGDDLLRAVEN